MITFKLMFDIGHWIVVVASAHLTNTRAETCNGQNNDIANLFGLSDACKMFPGDVALAGRHVKVVRVVEKGENGIGPDGRAGEFDNRVNGGFCQLAGFLATQSFVGDGSDQIAQDGMARLGLNGPLAELNAARVPVVPVRTVGVGFYANDHAVAGARDVGGHPFGGALQGASVNVRVDSSSCQQNQVAEKVGLEHGDGHGVVGSDNVGHGGVQVADQVGGDIVGDDLVHKGRVHLGPRGLAGAEVLVKVARGGRRLPRLPDVRRELGLGVVGELVGQLLAQRHGVQVLQRYLRTLLLVAALCF